jgi:putative MFS transporter
MSTMAQLLFERTPAAARLDRLPIASFHRRIVALLGYVFFFELGDLNSFAFAAPAVRDAWHLSITVVGRITAASFIGMFIGATTAGWLSDRIGRKRALIATTVWYSGFSLMNAFAFNVAALFATRLLTGVGLSAMTVVGMTYISEMFPARRRGTYQAWIMTIGLCGIPATAFVARFIIPAASWGWRAVFVWGSLGLLFPLFAGRLEESPRWCETHGRIAQADDILERIDRDVERETGPLPPPDRREMPAGPSGATFAGLFSGGTWKRTTLLVLVWICQTLGFYGFNSWVPTLLTERGFSIVHSLEQTSAMQIGAVPGAWIAAMISDRWERRSLIAIVAVAVATCGMIYGLSSTTATIVVFGFMVAMGQQVFAPLLYAYTPECFPTAVRNTGAGLSYGIGRLGNAFGPLLVAYLFNNYGYTSVFAYIAVCWSLVAILITAFGPRTRGRTLA